LLKFLDRRGHGADITNSVFVLSPIDEAVEVLAVGADIHEENRRFQSLGVFLADDGLLGGIHTTHGRTPTVAAGGVPGAHALDEGDFMRFTTIADPLDMPEIGAGGGEDPLELDAGDDVLIDTVAVLAPEPCVKDFEARGGDDGPDLDGFFFKGVIVVDGAGDAGIDALVAFRADPAGQASLRLRHGLFLGEADAHFSEVRPPVFGFHVGIFDPGNLGHLGNVGLVGQTLGPVLRPTRRDILAFQIAVDGHRRLLARINGLDDGLGTRNDIAAGKDAGNIRGEGYGIDVEVFPLVDGNAAFLGNEIEIRLLTDGGNQGVAGNDEFRTLDLHGAAAAAGIGLAEFHAGALHSRDLPVLPDDALGGHEEFHLDALFQCLFDLLGRGGHFRPGTAVEDEDVLGARTDRRPDGVHGDVAAADDGDLVAEENLFPEINPFQIIDAMDDALHLFAGDIQLAAVDCSATDKDRVIFLLELIEGNILADGLVQMNLDAEVLDDLDLRPEDVLGEAIFGDAHGKPAARHGEGFEDLHVIALGRQIVGAGKTGGTGADDGDLLALAFLLLGDKAGLVLQIQIGYETLQVHDINGIFHFTAHTRRLAGMVAHPAADDGEGIVFLDERQCFLVLTRGDEGHVALNADVGGTGSLAGGGAKFVDGEAAGNRLGELAISRLTF